MIRTVIRHSQRFAGLMLLAALAVTAAPAQPQNRKAVFVKQPATRDIRRQPREIARKPVERVLETSKSPAQRTAGQQSGQKEIFVKKPSGVSPKSTTEQQGGQKSIAVGEPNGRIKRKVEEQNDVPKKAKEASDGLKRQRIDPEPLTPTTGGPQKTKDAIGSPQRADQKSDGTAKVGGKKTADLRKKIKLAPQDGGRGTVIERKPKEDAPDLAKKKAKIKKTEARLAEEEAPSLIRRRNN